MKKVTLKLVAIFEIVCGIVGVSLAVTSLIGVLEVVVPRLWYGVLPLASVVAGVFLWRRAKWAVVLSALVQLVQIPVLRSESSLIDFVVAMKFPISAVWCAGDNCRLKLVLGVDILALGILVILLWSQSDLSNAPVADRAIEQALGAVSP